MFDHPIFAETEILNDINYVANTELILTTKVNNKIEEYIIEKGSYFRLEDVPNRYVKMIEGFILSRHIRVLKLEPKRITQEYKEVTEIPQDSTISDIVGKMLHSRETLQTVPEMYDGYVSQTSKEVRLKKLLKLKAKRALT